MKLPRILSTIAISSVVALAPQAFAAKDSNSFTPDQKKIIEQITHDYLINNPEVLVEVSQKLQEQQENQMKKIEENAQKAIPKLAKELFNDSNSPIIGNPKGNVTIVEFFDYQCPHCKNMSQVVDGIVKKDDKVRVVLKEFPIFGSSSVYASKAALAANKQGKYTQFHDALMETANPLTKEKVLEAAKSVGLNIDQLNKDMESKEVKDELDQNLKLAQKLGIMVTPVFIIGSTENAHNEKNKSYFIPGGGISEEVMQNFIVEIRKQDKA